MFIFFKPFLLFLVCFFCSLLILTLIDSQMTTGTEWNANCHLCFFSSKRSTTSDTIVAWQTKWYLGFHLFFFGLCCFGFSVSSSSSLVCEQVYFFGFAHCCVHALSLHVNRAIFFSHRLPPKSTHALFVCQWRQWGRNRQTKEKIWYDKWRVSE